MKRSKVSVALVAFVAGIAVATLIPALAQQASSTEKTWELSVTRPAGNSGNVTFVKYNRVTGQTLILSCINNNCGQTMSWWELQEDSAD